MEAKEPWQPEPEPDSAAEPPIPLEVIGTAHDLFSGELRPVYNRDPLPEELSQLPQTTPPATDQPTPTPATPEPEALPPAVPAAPPAAQAAAFRKDFEATLNRCFQESETWQLRPGSSWAEPLRQRIAAARDCPVAAHQTLQQTQDDAGPESQEPLWLEVNGQIGDAGLTMAQAMTLAWPGADAPDPAGGRELAAAAWRDLAKLQAAADAARTALAYWQGRQDDHPKPQS